METTNVTMKNLIALLISGALVVSGYSQTRNVLVGTNNAVVQPTNFWSADVTNARTGLGLGSAATNPATAFQPFSTVLSNLASSNGAGLTNLTAANITGTVGLASNVTGTIAISNGGSGATTAGGARTNLGLGATNGVTFNTVDTRGIFDGTNEIIDIENSWLNHTGFGVTFEWSDTANTTYVPFAFGGTNAALNTAITRTNLGLGATWLTNTNVTNFRTAIGLGASSDVVFRSLNAILDAGESNTIFFNSAISFDDIRSEDIVETTRTNLGLGLPALTNTNTTNFRTAIGLGWSALTNSNAAISLLGVATNGNVVYSGTNALTFTNALSFGTNVSTTRTNLGLGATNNVVFNEVVAFGGVYGDTNQAGLVLDTQNLSLNVNEIAIVNWDTNIWTFFAPFNFVGTNSAINIATSRTNLGLGWTALTNANTAGFNTSLYGSGTNPVLYNTNGEVVSPTNFWQVAPITTTFVEFDPPTNATTNIVAARNLHIHSLAISRTGVTSTIALPTTNSFNGDIALVVHQGPTSSVTAVRTAGAATNLITLNQFEEAVEFVYYNSVWQFNHNRSFIEPIFFSGTNAAANSAASRTNLGLGATNDVYFGSVIAESFREIDDESYITFQDEFLKLYADGSIVFDSPAIFGSSNIAAITRTNLGLGATNDVVFGKLTSLFIQSSTTNTYLEFDDDNLIIVANLIELRAPLFFNNSTNAAATRTNFGLPLAALTNTNNATFQEAVFTTNSAPTNGGNFGDRVGWMGVSMVTNGVTNVFRIPIYK
jgi:hypothetical protein